jgi:V8-like Glu-specific endopeptidase
MGYMKLAIYQRKLLEQALLSAFPSATSWPRLIQYATGDNIDTIVSDREPLADKVFKIVQYIEAHGKLTELIHEAREMNKGNVLLKRAEAELLVVETFEAIIRANKHLFSNPDVWRETMVQRERAICRIENPEGKEWGTGFLVADEIVLTCYHVWEKAIKNGRKPETMRFRFDYRLSANGIMVQGQVFQLAKKQIVQVSDSSQLDFVLLRLSDKPGMKPVFGYKGSPLRHWIQPSILQPKVGQVIFIIQHPDGAPIKLATGTVTRNEKGYVYYDANTMEGSSGAPVMSDDWSLLAVHQKGRLTNNVGISMVQIINELSADVRRELLI